MSEFGYYTLEFDILISNHSVLAPGAPLITSATKTSRAGSGATISDDSFFVAGVESLVMPRLSVEAHCIGVLLQAEVACVQARRSDMNKESKGKCPTTKVTESGETRVLAICSYLYLWDLYLAGGVERLVARTRLKFKLNGNLQSFTVLFREKQ